MYRKRITKSNELILEIDKYDTRKKERNVKYNVNRKKYRKKGSNQI